MLFLGLEDKEIDINNEITPNKHSAEQLLRLACTRIGTNNRDLAEETLLIILRYSVYDTNDTMDKLGVQPLDITKAFYVDSSG